MMEVAMDRPATELVRFAPKPKPGDELIDQTGHALLALIDDATRAEQWLEVIKNEIEVKLIAPMKANRAELPALH
jgi:hypothetical protein